MIIKTDNRLYCRSTGKALNTFSDKDRECISKTTSWINKGSLGTVYLAEELAKDYKAAYKGTSKKTIRYLHLLLIRLIENGHKRYIDVKQHKSIPLKIAGLRRIMEHLESIGIVELYKGRSRIVKDEHGERFDSVPSCVRIAYRPEDLEEMKDQAIENKFNK